MVSRRSRTSRTPDFTVPRQGIHARVDIAGDSDNRAAAWRAAAGQRPEHGGRIRHCLVERLSSLGHAHHVPECTFYEAQLRRRAISRTGSSLSPRTQGHGGWAAEMCDPDADFARPTPRESCQRDDIVPPALTVVEISPSSQRFSGAPVPIGSRPPASMSGMSGDGWGSRAAAERRYATTLACSSTGNGSSRPR